MLAWMGLEARDTMVFETADGGRMCVTVGSPRRIGGRAVAPLEGLAWPGLASDSRIFVPLDGALEFLVDRTPGPRPTVDALLPEDGGWSVGRERLARGGDHRLPLVRGVHGRGTQDRPRAGRWHPLDLEPVDRRPDHADAARRGLRGAGR